MAQQEASALEEELEEDCVTYQHVKILESAGIGECSHGRYNISTLVWQNSRMCPIFSSVRGRFDDENGDGNN